jgi:hypothetical protein
MMAGGSRYHCYQLIRETMFEKCLTTKWKHLFWGLSPQCTQ